MNNTYSISFISNACGVRPDTIRTWEKRYQAFSPERTDGGQRIYSENDLNKGRLIVSLLEQGHSISRLASKSLEDLRTLVIDEKIESVVLKLGVPRNSVHFIENYHEQSLILLISFLFIF